MSDPRFWQVCDELDELVTTVDVDGVDDIETLLMFLFQRPVGIAHSWNEDVGCDDLEVTVPGANQQVLLVQRFPTSVVQLVRSCAETVADLGPYTAAPAEESPDVRTLRDEELTAALQQALGSVRLSKLMYPDEEA